MAAGLEERSYTAKKESMARLFSQANWAKLQRLAVSQRVAAGSCLFREGDATEKWFYLYSGRVKLTQSTEEGRDLILSILQEGEFIGAMEGFGEDVHSFSAKVVEDAEVGIITRHDLDLLCRQDGSFSHEFIQWMGLQQRTAQSKFRDLLLFGKSGALASTLIRLSNTFGVACPEGVRLDIAITHTEIADMIGSTRESVNRTLNAFKDQGTLGVENGQIIIRRMSDLRETCQCPRNPACPVEICRL